MATDVAQPLPKLYVYENCPFCVRARWIFGLKNVDHELVFVAYHDAVTPVKLVGAKQTPILQLVDGKAFPESADIVKYVDENWGGASILKPSPNREDFAAWQKKSMMDFMGLQFPRMAKTPFAELAQKKSREYLLTKQERFGSFDDLLAMTPELLEKANQHLVELEGLLFSDRLVNEGGLTYDDIVVFSTLRGLTLVKGLKWPAKLRSYVEYYSEVADIPLLDAMAQ